MMRSRECQTNCSKIRPAILAASIALATAIGVSGLCAQEMFLSGPDRNAVYETAGIAELTGVKWSFQTEGHVYASPVQAGSNIYIGSGDGKFYALDAETGLEVWRLDTGGAVHSTAAIANGVAYFLSESGHLYAVNADDGSVAWTFATGGEHQQIARSIGGRRPFGNQRDFWDFLLSSPVVADGVVYFGSSDGNVYAVSANTGEKVWSYEADGVVHGAPALVDGVLFASDLAGAVHAINAANGEQIWRFETRNMMSRPSNRGVFASPVVHEGVVYFGARDPRFYALDAATGEKLWHFSTGGTWILSAAAIAHDTVFVGSSDGRSIFALDVATGDRTYSRYLGESIFSVPAIAGDIVYFGVTDGRFIAMNAHDGEFMWEFETDGRVENKELYLDDRGGIDLAAIAPDANLNDHNEVTAAYNAARAVGSIFSSALVGDGVIYFGSGDGKVYALEGTNP